MDDFADKGALVPLDAITEGTGIVAERYLPVYWDMVHYRGHLWALPSAPVIAALHLEQRFFRQAGLDPEQPPRTIAELDEYAKRHTRRNEAERGSSTYGLSCLRARPLAADWGFLRRLRCGMAASGSRSTRPPTFAPTNGCRSTPKSTDRRAADVPLFVRPRRLRAKCLLERQGGDGAARNLDCEFHRYLQSQNGLGSRAVSLGGAGGEPSRSPTPISSRFRAAPRHPREAFEFSATWPSKARSRSCASARKTPPSPM